MVIAVLVVMGCSDTSGDRDRIANLQVAQDEWEPLEPREPPSPDPRFDVHVSRVLREGTGRKIARGDLVQVRLRTPASANGKPQSDVDVTGWLWMGFGRDNTYDFSTQENETLPALLLGLAQGTALQVTKNFSEHYSDTVGYANGIPFGPRSEFDNRAKSGARAAQYRALFAGGIVYADGRPHGEGTTIEIVRVCRGRPEQQLITIIAAWPVRTAQDFNAYTSTVPRYQYLRRARWTGICDDGRPVRYEIGPIRVQTPSGKPDAQWNLDKSPWQWAGEQWEAIEPGVRLEP